MNGWWLGLMCRDVLNYIMTMIIKSCWWWIMMRNDDDNLRCDVEGW
jgi:hypothetical protein